MKEQPEEIDEKNQSLKKIFNFASYETVVR